MLAEWYGGPFDGTVVNVVDDHPFYVVAYDWDGQPLPGWPSLQDYALDPNHDDPVARFLGVAKIVIYPVISGYVWFSETGVVIAGGDQ